MKERLFILSQYLLPHHLLSRLIGCAAAMMTDPENLMQVFGHTEKR